MIKFLSGSVGSLRFGHASMTRFPSTLVAVALLASTGCFTTARGQREWSESRQHEEARQQEEARQREDAREHEKAKEHEKGTNATKGSAVATGIATR